jgi:hypothetical protein
LKPGLYRVSVGRPGDAASAWPRETVRLEAGLSVEVTIGGPGTADVSGAVRDEEGSPLVDAHIVMAALGGSKSSAPPRLFGTTDPSGRFAFRGVEPGEYGWTLHRPRGGGSLTGRVVVPRGGLAGWEIVVRPRGPRLTVRVEHADTGAPLPGVRATLYRRIEPPGGTPGKALFADVVQKTTDADGVTDLENVPPGTYRLVCRATGFEEEKRDLTLTSDLPGDIRVELRPTHR